MLHLNGTELRGQTNYFGGSPKIILSGASGEHSSGSSNGHGVPTLSCAQGFFII